MSCSEEKKKHDRKKGLLKICYVSEAALTTAAGVFQWMDPAASLLGFTLAKPAVELAKEATRAWCDDVDVEAEYLRAVEEALERTRAHFSNNKSKLAILRELSERVDEIDMDLATIIEKTETFQTQYMTMIDTKEILTEFEHHFSLVVPKYKSLTGFYIIRTSNRTLDLLKRVHIIVEADSSKIENILNYVKKTNDDVIQIKEDVKQVKSGVDSLKEFCRIVLIWLRYAADIFVQSMIVFCAFTVVSTLFEVYSIDSFKIYSIVLVSELLIRFLLVRIDGLQTTIAVVATQAFFITSCSFFMTGRRDILELLCVGVCAFLGVGMKYLLRYFQKNSDHISA